MRSQVKACSAAWRRRKRLVEHLRRELWHLQSASRAGGRRAETAEEVGCWIDLGEHDGLVGLQLHQDLALLIDHLLHLLHLLLLLLHLRIGHHRHWAGTRLEGGWPHGLRG